MMTRLDETLGFYENALRLRSQRQQLLASNIANADTPHYKARDMNFAQAMQDALGRRQSSVAMAQTHPQHLVAEASLALPYEFERQALQNSQDGNTVDMDVERNAFTENALRYETAVSLAHDQIKNVLNVLQG